MSDQSIQLQMCLDALKAELQRADLWSADRPPPECFASQLPFFADTMRFEVWLQFVFIERLEEMMRVGAPLPAISGVAAMAEYEWRGQLDEYRELVCLIRDADEVLGQ